jgi:hypothetical protein
MMPEPLDERLNLALTKSMMRAIDEWRRVQPDIPTRSEAARRLIEASLKPPPGKPGKPTR